MRRRPMRGICAIIILSLQASGCGLIKALFPLRCQAICRDPATGGFQNRGGYANQTECEIEGPDDCATLDNFEGCSCGG